ncbi:MAG: DUF2281 domain-containing protein [bacterium]|nr:DUF2281 domain-containing protein [bacterium]
MNPISSEAIIRKFEVLPENAKKEVADFIDFLAQKKKTDKRRLPEVSSWADDAIKAIEEAGEEINNIPIEWAKSDGDIMALAGIWKDNPRTIEEIREKAWKRT